MANKQIAPKEFMTLFDHKNFQPDGSLSSVKDRIDKKYFQRLMDMMRQAHALNCKVIDQNLQLKTNENESIVFQRNINEFYEEFREFYQFGVSLVRPAFLGKLYTSGRVTEYVKLLQSCADDRSKYIRELDDFNEKSYNQDLETVKENLKLAQEKI